MKPNTGVILITLCGALSAFLFTVALDLISVPRMVWLLGLASVTILYAAGVEMLPRRQETAVRTVNHLLAVAVGLVGLGAIIGTSWALRRSPRCGRI